jgi:hypothetical protein
LKAEFYSVYPPILPQSSGQMHSFSLLSHIPLPHGLQMFPQEAIAHPLSVGVPSEVSTSPSQHGTSVIMHSASSPLQFVNPTQPELKTTKTRNKNRQAKNFFINIIVLRK